MHEEKLFFTHSLPFPFLRPPYSKHIQNSQKCLLNAAENLNNVPENPLSESFVACGKTKRLVIASFSKIM